VALFISEPDPWGAATNYLNELRIQSFIAAQGGMDGAGAGAAAQAFGVWLRMA
jgi:hypothetical protein